MTCRVLFFYFYLFFCFFRAAPEAHGVSQDRGPIGVTSCWPTPQLQQQQIRAASVTYTTAHGNTEFLTCWVRLGIEHASSWFPVGFISTAPRRELWFVVVWTWGNDQYYLAIFVLSLSFLRISELFKSYREEFRAIQEKLFWNMNTRRITVSLGHCAFKTRQCCLIMQTL